MIDPARTLARLRGLHGAARRARADGDVRRLVDALAATAADALGYGTVVIHVHRPAWDDVEVAAVAGPNAVRERLLGSTAPLAHWESLLDDRFRRGEAYFAAADAADLPPTADAAAWRRGDTLLVPLRRADGELLAVLAADEPLDGQRPDDATLELVAHVAAYAAHALETAQDAIGAARHRAALEHLLSVSAKLGANESAEPILDAVCEGIRAALHFRHVVIELADRAADRYVPCAGAASLQLDVPIARLDAVFDPRHEVEGCYLLTRADALELVGAEPSSFASELNGVGPRAWNRHWLLVPLHDRNGERLGFIWADDPEDRLIPSREQLQALRLFADQAATALDAAARYERLHEADEARRALVDASRAGIVVIGRDRRVRWWNPAARELFGYADEEVLGHEPPWIPQEERAAFRERFEAMIETGVTTDRVFLDRHRDGTDRWVATSNALLRDRDGEVTGVVATITDMTAEEESKRQLARRNAELEALNDTTLALIETLDPKGLLETIVDRAAQLVGSEGAWMYLVDEERDELVFEIGTGIFARHVGDRTGRHEGLAGAVVETGAPLAVDDYAAWEGRMDRFADAGFRAVAGVPLRSGSAVVGALGIGHRDARTIRDADVELLSRFGQLASLALANARLYAAAQRELEERRAAEEALRRSQVLYRAILENSADLISVLDPQGNVLYASPAHERVLGWSVEELQGSAGAMEHVHPDDAPGAADVLRRCLEGDPVETYAARLRHKDGGWVTLEGAPTVIPNASGEPEMLLVVARDVTARLREEQERERLEEQLRQSQKMEAIGRLAGGIAHDFNNLLTAISGYGELAAARLAPGSPPHRHVAEMRRAAERAGGLTRQLLAFSRKQVLQPEVLNVNDVVSTMSDMLGRVLGEDVELVTSLDPDVGQTRADPGQLEQVVLNLAVNARDAMPRGGRLTIETANVELDEAFAARHAGAAPGEYVGITVSDTGEGMDAATAERVFEPFFTTKPAGEGTGLGLSTVYGIVKQTGGSIWVYSEPGHGTTFRVYLPRVWDRTAEREARTPPPRAAGEGTVLVVEDNATVRDLVAELLEQFGYTVVTAANGDEALSIAAAHEASIDLLVTDVVMPGMSGQELAAALTASRPGLQVLFTSGYTEQAIANHGVLLPGARFLEKPFTSDQLARALSDVLPAPPLVA